MHDAGGQRDLVAAQPEGVAVAVGTLVVQFDYRQVRLEERDLAQDAGAERRMALDLLVLLGRQRLGLLQDLVGQPDLADVVEQRAEPDDGHLGLGQPHLPGDDH